MVVIICMSDSWFICFKMITGCRKHQPDSLPFNWYQEKKICYGCFQGVDSLAGIHLETPNGATYVSDLETSYLW